MCRSCVGVTRVVRLRLPPACSRLRSLVCPFPPRPSVRVACLSLIVSLPWLTVVARRRGVQSADGAALVTPRAIRHACSGQVDRMLLAAAIDASSPFRSLHHHRRESAWRTTAKNDSLTKQGGSAEREGGMGAREARFSFGCASVICAGTSALISTRRSVIPPLLHASHAWHALCRTDERSRGLCACRHRCISLLVFFVFSRAVCVYSSASSSVDCAQRTGRSVTHAGNWMCGQHTRANRTRQRRPG